MSVAPIAAIPKGERPKPVDLDRCAVGDFHRTHRCSGREIECIDLAITKISDEQSTPERPEPGRRQRQAPRRIQDSGRDELMNKLSARGENIHITMAWPREVIDLVDVLHGISND